MENPRVRSFYERLESQGLPLEEQNRRIRHFIQKINQRPSKRLAWFSWDEYDRYHCYLRCGYKGGHFEIENLEIVPLSEIHELHWYLDLCTNCARIRTDRYRRLYEAYSVNHILKSMFL